MSLSDLHREIEAIATHRGGMVLSAALIKTVVLDSIRTAATYAARASLSFPTGEPSVDARFLTMSVVPSQFVADLVDDGSGKLAVRIGPKFTITLQLVCSSNPALAFSDVEFQVPTLDLPLDGVENAIRIGRSGAFVTAKVNDALVTRQQAIDASGITLNTLLRVEGAVAYTAGNNILTMALGDLPAIDLRQMFPALSFSGDLELHKVRSALLVIPQYFSVLGNVGCPQGDSTAGSKIVPQTPTSSGPLGHIIDFNNQVPPPVHITILDKDGYAAAYLPKPLLDVHFGKIAPAINFHDETHGLIAVSVDITAVIKDVTVTIDPARKGIKLALGFRIHGTGELYGDVQCLGRVNLGRIDIDVPEPNDTSSQIEVLVRPAIDSSYRLIMITELTNLNLGKASVKFDFFGKWLSYFGGEAAIEGVAMDFIIGTVIAHALPPLLTQMLKDNLNQHFFVLADLKTLLKYFGKNQAYLPNFSTYSGDAASALIGLLGDG